VGLKSSVDRARGWKPIVVALGAAAAVFMWNSASAQSKPDAAPAAAPTTEDATATEEPENKFLKASLISEKSAVAPGESFVLGVQLDVAPGWHTYWPGLNDTGVAPIFHNLQPSKNLSLKPVEYPAPTRYINVGLLDHAYEGSAVLLIPATVAATAKPGERVTLEIDLEFLVCKDTCIPGRSMLKIELPVQEKSAVDGKGTAAIKAAQARLGRPLPASVTTTWKSPDRLTIATKDATFIAFYPAASSRAPNDLIASGENSRGGSLDLTFDPVKAGASSATGAARVTGLLEVRRATAAGATPEAAAPGAMTPGVKPQPKIVSEFYTVDLAPPDASVPAKAPQPGSPAGGSSGGGGNQSTPGGVRP